MDRACTDANAESHADAGSYAISADQSAYRVAIANTMSAKLEGPLSDQALEITDLKVLITKLADVIQSGWDNQDEVFRVFNLRRWQQFKSDNELIQRARELTKQ
jgi:hypothetical protein